MHDLFLDKLMKVLDQFAEPKEHVLETVEKLRRAGIRIGSTTGYTDEMMAIVTREQKRPVMSLTACLRRIPPGMWDVPTLT